MKNKFGIFRLIRHMGKYRLLMAGMFLFSLAGNVSLLFAPKLIASAIDLIELGDRGFSFLYDLLIVGILYFVGALLNWLASLCANVASNRTVQDLRTSLFDKLGRLPLSYYDNQSHGDIISRFTNDINAIADGLDQGILQLVSGTITIVVSFIFMLSLNTYVTLAAVAIMPVSFFTGFFLTKYGKKKFQEQSRVLGKLNGYAEEIISGHHTVKAYGYEVRAESEFSQINGELYECGYRAQFSSALVNPSTRFVNNIAYVLVGVLGIIAVMRGALTKGGVAGFLTYITQFSKPINEITSVTMQLQLAAASAFRIFSLLEENEQTPDNPTSAQLIGAKGLVKFENVSFSYEPQRPLIKKFNLSVRPGETIAIVGPTGAGKTTLVNLLMRFYEIDKGQILIDGSEITTFTRDSLRRSFGMVLQDTWLFSGTIRENIAYGRPFASNDEIEKAARLAHAHSFIKRLPNAYNSYITEDGNNLSQGQKQLLTIARAMLIDPPMLILDEATSSVDIVTEARIQRAFRNIMHGKTTFIIAHRLSTIRDADRILVLNQGDVVEQGRHEELLALGGFYSRLYNAQFMSNE